MEKHELFVESFVLLVRWFHHIFKLVSNFHETTIPFDNEDSIVDQATARMTSQN